MALHEVAGEFTNHRMEFGVAQIRWRVRWSCPPSPPGCGATRRRPASGISSAAAREIELGDKDRRLDVPLASPSQAPPDRRSRQSHRHRRSITAARASSSHGPPPRCHRSARKTELGGDGFDHTLEIGKIHRPSCPKREPTSATASRSPSAGVIDRRARRPCPARRRPRRVRPG